MYKNTASQKWIVFAFQDEGGTNPGEPVTGDAANITANLRLDGGAANAVDDLNPTELEDGYYAFDLTQAETNADNIVICPVSGTANVNVIGVPGAVYTRTDVSGIEAKIDTVDTVVDAILVDTGTTLPATLGTPAGASLAADVASVQSDLTAVDTVVDAILADTGTDGVVIAAAQTVATVTDVTNQVSADVTAISGSATAADNLEASALGVISGTTQAGSSTTSIVTNLTDATDDVYIGRIIVWTSGTAAGEATDITDYNGTTKTLTVTATAQTPANGDNFVIV